MLTTKPSSTCPDRHALTLTYLSLLLTLCIVLMLVATPTRADLSPAFAGKLVVDTAYLIGATQPTDIAFAGDGRAIITQKGGQIRVRRSDGSVAVVAYPFGGTLDTASEKGLLGVIADPNVAQNNAFYFYVSNGPTNDKHRVYRAVLNPNDTFTVDPTPIIGASRGFGPGLEGPANHDGGGLNIYNGQLYVSVGDTGANASPPTNKYGSCLNKGNGKILRVNLDGTIPIDNPLNGLVSVTACASPNGAWTTAAPDPRIYAWGFRNPWRFWVDPETGLLWIGDVGESTKEEISVGGGNQHYGYPFEEGDQIWGSVQGQNCNTMTPSRPCTPPVHAYGRSVGQSVTGGLILSSTAWRNAFGGTVYVFSDAIQSWLRALPVNANRTGLTSTTAVEWASYPGATTVSLRLGPDGALYVVQLGGAVYRVTPVAGAVPIPSLNSWAAALLALLITALAVPRVSETQKLSG